MSTPSTPVATWVRIALIALGIPNAAAGLWGVLAPESWYDSFPGWDPPLVAAEPPYNEHLATDAGAGLLASGLALLAAAWLGDRRSVRFGVVAFLAFAVPHTVWHAANESPKLTSSQDAQNVATLVFGLVVGAVVLIASGRSPRAVGEPTGAA